MMIKNNIGLEQEINTSKYLKSLVEGMHDWVEVKSLTGNEDLAQCKEQLDKEIENYKKTEPSYLTRAIIEKMASLGIEKDLLKEFKSVFAR